MRDRRHSGPPTWFILLLGVAIVFGLYYMWLGLRNFMASGVSVAGSTHQAIVRNTATAVRILEIEVNAPSPLPSLTPIPPCLDFEVRVPIAIVRKGPDISSGILGSKREGEVVCVISAVPDTEWYLIDERPLTRRIESVYMHRDIVRALNPTAIPSKTPIPTATRTPTRAPTPIEAPPTAAAAQADQPRLPTPTLRPSATALPPSVNL